MTRLVVAAKARQQMRYADQWWQANRPKNPGLFQRELLARLRDIVENPGLFRRYPHPRRANVRRAPMLGTGHAIYYEHNIPKDTVEVLSVWSSLRGRGPF